MTRKLRSTLLIGALTLSLMLTACGSQPETPAGGEAGSSAPAAGVAFNKVEFSPVSLEEAPAAVADWVNSNREKGGTFSVADGDDLYLVIAAGEKPSGGYEIELVSVGESEGTLEVVYKVNEPGPDVMVAMMIDYPVKIVKVQNHNLPVNFKVAQ